MHLIQQSTGRVREFSDRMPAGDLDWYLRHGWLKCGFLADPTAAAPAEPELQQSFVIPAMTSIEITQTAKVLAESAASDPSAGAGLDPEPEPELPAAAAAPAEEEESHSEPEKSNAGTIRFRQRRGARQ